MMIEPLEDRIAPANLANIDLSNLDGVNGFKMKGVDTQDGAGFSVSAAGDVNDDGFADVIVGAPNASSGGAETGVSYVVFGKASGFSASIDLGALDGTDGFAIKGGAAGDGIGMAVTGAGDINGDGIDDLAVGAPSTTGAGADSGAAYVIFGKTGAFAASINVANLNGTNGFKISAAAAGDKLGSGVSAAGDVNGDGIDDLIVGAAFLESSQHSRTGAAYVIFGKSDWSASANFNVSALNGTNGFKIANDLSNGHAGASVASGGDINGDGFDDVVVGASAYGKVFVVFGKGDWSATPTLNVSSLNGTNGFTLINGTTGNLTAVGGHCDVNGDGFDDVIVGDYLDHGADYSTGSAFVVFGKSAAFSASVDVTALNGSNGFKLAGVTRFDLAGGAVSNAGDLNGDGIGDIVVGATGADPHAPSSGAAYVIYGKSTAFAATLNLSALDGTNGFKLSGEAQADYAGISVSAAGDVNGDGFDDLLVGADYAGSSPVFAGAAYLIFGGPHIGGGGGAVTIAKNGKSATFTDVDGDLVTVKTSKGKLTADVFSLTPSGSGFQLEKFDIHDRSNFNGANLTFSAKTPRHGVGDGLLDVGFIDATGVDLGAVSVDGNLEKIVAGDSVLKSAGVKSLKVASLGKESIATPGTGEEYHSVIAGKLGQLTVMHDVTSAELEVTGGLLGSIGKIKIGGSLLGDTFDESGSIYAEGNMGAVLIGGDIAGGLGVSSGRLATGLAPAGGSIKSVVVHGSLVGGVGQMSGEIGSDTTVGSILIDGSITNGIIDIAGRMVPTKAKAALALKSLTVKGDVSGAFIGIGYRASGFAINADVQVGKVSVDGAWSASSLAVGVEDSTHDGFGRNDTLIAGGSDAIVATIASITIKGAATGSATSGDFFGITAELVKKGKIHGTTVALSANQDDVLLDLVNNDFRLVEV